MADDTKRSEWRRFLDVLSSGHPGEILSDIVTEYALIRRVLFLVLTVLAWGNWRTMAFLAVLWAGIEAWAWFSRWLSAQRGE